LELVNSKPFQIEEIQYSYLSFDAQGRLDQTDFEKQVRLAMEFIGSSDSDQKTGRVIYARHRFAEKRLQDQYRWIPSPELETAILNAALGKR